MAADVLELEARLKDYISGEMGNITRSLEQFSGKMQDTKVKHNKSTSEMEGAVRNLGDSWNVGKIALTSFVGAFGAMSVVNTVTNFLKSARAEYQENVAVQLRLKTALGFTSDALNEQAKILGEKLIVDDDEITKVQAMLANYVKSEEAIKLLTPAILDLAAATGMDMASAANVVAKAINDDGEQLGKFKIKVEGTAQSLERIQSVFDGIEKKFKGQAEAAAQAKDSWDSFGVTYGNILETIGRSDIIQGAGLWVKMWGEGVKATVDEVFKETVSTTKEATAALNALSNEANLITGQWKDRQKIFDQVSMQTHQGRLQLYARQYKELYDQSIAAHDLIAADSIRIMYYGPNGIITKEKEAEAARIAQKKEDAAKLLQVQQDSANLMNSLNQDEAKNDPMRIAEAQGINEVIARENALAEIRQKNAGKEYANKEKNINKDKKATSDRINQIGDQTNYMLDSLAMVAKASKASAGIQKGIDIAQATANTAIGVTNAISKQQYWMIPFIVAMGGAQIAMIAQQKYAGGGIVGGGSPASGDTVPAMLTPGEMILNGQQQANLFNQLNRPNVSNSSQINLSINVGDSGNYDMNAARYTVDSLIPILGDALVRAKSEGRLRDYEAAR